MDVERFRLVRRSSCPSGFLIVAALSPYKRLDIAIRAARQGGFRLTIVGGARAQQIAGAKGERSGISGAGFR